MHQQAHFITYNESRPAPLRHGVGSSLQQQQQQQSEWSSPLVTEESSSSTVTITPTSTPPVRVISQKEQQRRRMDRYYGKSSSQLSPSPLTTETQKRYYEDSTWRMYDRIQSSRPITLKNCMQLLPPQSSDFSSQRQTSSFASFPRFTQSQGMEGQINEALTMAQEHQEDQPGDHDEELIFDLEL